MPMTDQKVDYDVLIVGGGTGGISVAARLAKFRRLFPRVAVLDPTETHDYQPLWTLVGGGVMPKQVTRRKEIDQIPTGVIWLKDAAAEFLPDANAVRTASGRTLRYTYLVVAPGISLEWSRVKGLEGALGKDGVASNYSYDLVDKTWDFIREFKGGNALFTHPSTPIKCGGAPQKIMYLAEDHWRRMGIRDKCQIEFCSAGAAIFAVKKYADALTRVVQSRGMLTRFKHDLVEVDAGKRLAIFKNLDGGTLVPLPYDFLHVTPPMAAPKFVRDSALANEAGWVDVHKHTLQHNKFPNVFSLGDASSLPTSKTGAAIRKQAPVLVANLVALAQSQPLAASYDGYTSCPLVTGYGKLILAEFDYEPKPCETFPFDQSKERLSMYLLKKYVLPRLYWDGMMKGRA